MGGGCVCGGVELERGGDYGLEEGAGVACSTASNGVGC